MVIVKNGSCHQWSKKVPSESIALRSLLVALSRAALSSCVAAGVVRVCLHVNCFSTFSLIIAVHTGADATLVTSMSQAMSASRLQPVHRQMLASQAQQDPLEKRLGLHRSTNTAQSQALFQLQPQLPATNAWMEKLLQELSLDDEDCEDVLAKVSIIA